jgi:ribosomal-protein-serine acetyltransferase
MAYIYIDDDTFLRPLLDNDAEELFSLINDSRLYLRQWLPWVDSTIIPADSLTFIMNARDQEMKNIGLHRGIFYKGALAGVVGFHNIDSINRSTMIGYWLGSKYQGKGLMTGACKSMINYAFSDLNINRVEIRCATDNKKSRAIPEKLGFKNEGNLREAALLNGQYIDLNVYGIIRSEWKKG